MTATDLVPDSVILRELNAAWDRLFDKKDRLLAAEAWRRVTAAYREPHRHYHTLTHIHWCLAEMNVRPFSPTLCVPGDEQAARLALIFHDVVYDPRAKDNEEKSAEAFRSWVVEGMRMWSAYASGLAVDVIDAILATKTHRPREGAHPVCHYVCDVDLSILGANAATYRAYVAAVRKEYDFVTDAQWREGRAVVLQGLLDRAWIYHRKDFQDAYEARARENLKAELFTLAQPASAAAYENLMAEEPPTKVATPVARKSKKTKEKRP